MEPDAEPDADADAGDGLSTFAIRLEVQALRDLHRALQEMKEEVSAPSRGVTVG